MAIEQFNLMSGPVQVRYPDKMDAQDVRDFEDTLALLLRGVRRRNAGDRDTGQGAEAVRLNGDLGPRTSVSDG